MEIVYVLSNPAMPGLVKIGFTSQDDSSSRIAGLYTTGVPVPFSLEFACRVPNGEEVEKALHRAFAPNRINPRREFFKIEPDQAIAILRLLHVEDATQEVLNDAHGVDAQSLEAAEQLKDRRPNLNFEEMGIPISAELRQPEGDEVAIVTGPKRVRFRGEEMSLTAATRLALGISYSVAPGPHWVFKGKRVRDIYNETYGAPE